jgi:DNA replication protein DnaC
MKPLNIISLLQAYDTLKKEEYKLFLSYYNIKIRNDEIKDLKIFIGVLNLKKRVYNDFFVGYEIPQISKEFDLLKFGKEYYVNIELKNSSSEDEIKKQLLKNRYYLSFLDKPVHHFTFVAGTKELFYLDNENLEKVELDKLKSLLENQEVLKIENIDKLFDPTNYLISPFNTTDRFLKNEYFLTDHQQRVKDDILEKIEDNSEANFFALRGNAGTGKTLLTYDMAKEAMQKGKKVLIIHCGILNNGQDKLKENEWEIIPIKKYVKKYESYDLSKYDFVIIDEAQRIYPEQFEEIINNIKKCNGNCAFSYDEKQTLSRIEAKHEISNKIQCIDSIHKYKLTDKIRTNKDIASFIKMFFNEKRNDLSVNKEYIEISYFNNDEDVKGFTGVLSQDGWKVLRFTPSQYNNERHEKYVKKTFSSSHEVIGQEFDNVAVVIDDCFKYSYEGALQYLSKSHYHPVQMLFQNLTRTRKNLHIVINNNEEVLNRCLSILNERSK